MNIQRVFSKVFTLLALIGMVWACSSPNSKATTLDAAGKHAANWIVDHRPSFLSNQSPCRQCHGSDLLGGISRVSCFSPEFSGQACHANGPVGHPDGWRDRCARRGLGPTATAAQPG